MRRRRATAAKPRHLRAARYNSMYDDNFEIIESDGFILTEMTEGAARTIAGWQYGEGFEMYDFDGSEEELEQVMNGLHFPVYEAEGFDRNNRSIIVNPAGFVAIGPAAKVTCKSSGLLYGNSTATDIAIGLRPDLCGLGKGIGVRLVGIAVNFVLHEFPDDGVRLSVDENNQRAIKVYEKFGFERVDTFDAFVKIKGKRKKKKFILMDLRASRE